MTKGIDGAASIHNEVMKKNSFESPATVELSLCFLLLILSFTTLSSLRWN